MPIPVLAAYALAEVEDCKRALMLDNDDSNVDDLLTDLINSATATIENYLHRRVVRRDSSDVTEYHTVPRAMCELYLRDFPIISVTDVWEDIDRQYTNSTKLVVNTDYLVVNGVGRLDRIFSSTGGRRTWRPGFRVVKVAYKGGYATLTDVPADIREVCRRLVELHYREKSRQLQGAQASFDPASNITRFHIAHFTKEMRAILNAHRAPVWSHTYELV